MNTTLPLTEGASQTEDDIKLVNIPQAWKILIVVFMTIVFVLTVIGNVVVVVVIKYSSVFRSVANSHFLISLSIADFLVAALVMPCALDAVNTGKWRCGHVWGRLNGFGNFLFCISSIMHLMMLSVDRYMAIARPLYYPMEMTKSRALFLCLAMWLYSALWAFLPLFGVSSYECFISYIGTCEAKDWSKFGLNFAFAISVVSGTYGIALLSMVFVYFKIGRVIRNQLQRTQEVASGEDQKSRNEIEQFGLFHKTKQTKFANKMNRQKGLVTLITVTLVYLICWSPFCILLFIEIGTGEKVRGPYGTLAMFVGFTNSCCNPIIYSIKYRRFRSAVIRLLVKKNLVSDLSLANAQNAQSGSLIVESRLRRVRPAKKSESIL